MFKLIAVLGAVWLLAFGASAEPLSQVVRNDGVPQPPSRTQEILTDAAIVAVLIAASIAAYKAS
ncbi:MAG: hypothetical protein AB7O65_10160, partial [Candidatus Korobacteraceae bacterium]